MRRSGESRRKVNDRKPVTLEGRPALHPRADRHVNRYVGAPPKANRPNPLPTRAFWASHDWQVFWLGSRSPESPFPRRARSRVAVAVSLSFVVPYSGGAAPELHRVPLYAPRSIAKRPALYVCTEGTIWPLAVKLAPVSHVRGPYRPYSYRYEGGIISAVAAEIR